MKRQVETHISLLDTRWSSVVQMGSDCSPGAQNLPCTEGAGAHLPPSAPAEPEHRHRSALL